MNGRALHDAVDDIADMAQRVQATGPEPVYASEKLAFAVFKAAEALALCGVELELVLERVREGHARGRWMNRHDS